MSTVYIILRQFGDAWTYVFTSLVQNFSIKALLIFILIMLLLLVILWYFNFTFAVELVDNIIYFTSPFVFVIKFLINFFIITPCKYLYMLTLDDWKKIFIWISTVFFLSTVYYFFYIFLFKTILFKLSYIQVKILFFILFLFGLLFCYCWYKKFKIALKFIIFIIFVFNPIYKLILNLIFFFFVNPSLFIYNLTIEDWKNIGVVLIMVTFMLVFLYTAYLFLGLCLKDLRWLEVVFMPVGYGKPSK